SALAQPWHGLVYVSATMRAKELGQKEFREGWKNRPLLVLHGRADHNVSPRMAEKSIEVLRQGGAEVSAEWYDKEDHFLTFGAADAVDERIARWIRTSRTEPDRSSAAAFA
ncbi:MAG: alpha/beta hydrolase family protein, partial [bacterium]